MALGAIRFRFLNEQGEKALGKPRGPMRPCGCRETAAYA